MKILVTGKDGFLGRNIVKHLEINHQVVSIGHKDVDLTDTGAVDKFFYGRTFNCIIHTAIKGGNRLIQDDSNVTVDNLKMHYNLTKDKDCYEKFISIGSGAEVVPRDYYGLSKYYIRQSVMNNQKSTNLKVYAVFGEDEADSRFIKSSIRKYINKESIIIHQDKIMSFFYIQDFLKVLDEVLRGNISNKEVACCYPTYQSLYRIASIINNLGDHKVDIVVQNDDKGVPYAEVNFLGFNTPSFLGLEEGIKRVYLNMI